LTGPVGLKGVSKKDPDGIVNDTSHRAGASHPGEIVKDTSHRASRAGVPLNRANLRKWSEKHGFFEVVQICK